MKGDEGGWKIKEEDVRATRIITWRKEMQASDLTQRTCTLTTVTT